MATGADDSSQLQELKTKMDDVSVSMYDEDEIIAKHKKEKKELQGKVQKLKKSVPKGDKKKKKEIDDQISQLENDLDKNQKAEISAFQENKVKKDETTKPENTEEISIVAEDQPSGGDDSQNIKKSKAQKRRDKKQAAGREREERIKEQEVVNKLGPRHLEMVKIKEILKNKGLKVHEIQADGNCLYSAISHQLTAHSHHKQSSTNQELRQMTSDFMRSHRDDFLPFLTDPDTGDMLTTDEFEKYCDKTATTPCWGGQIELRALSESLQVPIEVIQADSTPIVVGEEMEDKPLTVVYHRHMLRLGEHYNSVDPYVEEEEEDL